MTDFTSFCKNYNMDGGEKGSTTPGADISLSICKSKSGDYNVILRGKILENLAVYAELIFLLDNLTEKDTVNIYISSPGGGVITGIAIASAITRCAATTNTIIAGLAASIAAVIWLSGKNIFTLPYSLLMIHGSSHLDGGKSVLVAKKAIAYSSFSEYMNHKAVQLGVITEEEYLSIVDDHHDHRLFGSDLMRRCKIWSATAA